ncbi:hypothetical protein V2J09_022229 [Rumex salicifolius]
MEIAEESPSLRHEDCPEPLLPSLINHISTNRVADFDTIQESDSFILEHQPNRCNLFSASARESREAAGTHEWKSPLTPIESKKAQSVSISMPPTPTGRHLQEPKRVLLCDHHPNSIANGAPISAPLAVNGKFYSQPMPKGALYMQSNDNNNPESIQPKFGKDSRFASFKTRTGKIERQLSALRGRRTGSTPRLERSHHVGGNALPADQSMLPNDKSWPFLLRYTVSTFGICLGVSSQAILWKTLATSGSTKFLHISLKVNLVLWIISVALIVIISIIYLLKLIFYFEAVRREYYHPIRVNFFFAPWISLLFLCLGVPPSIAKTLPLPLWYVLMTPLFCLELKIYGQWMSGGRRRLSKVANPSNHLSVVGNFVGSLLGATMGLKEGPLFFFGVGVAHYTVLFVTLYQRLPTNETLPKELHPVFFLFVAAPSVSSMAWAAIQGSFDYGSRIAYFIAMFLYLSLAVRVNFFRGFKFSLTWWAYTFPMTGAAIATIRYSNEVRCWFTQALSVTLCTVSVLIVTALLVSTVIHAFVLRDLYPNDTAIAITETPPRKRWFHDQDDDDGIQNLFNGIDVEAPPACK